MKLQRRTIAAIGPVEAKTIFWDSELTGFGLIVRPSGANSFICGYRARGSSTKRRVTLGSTSKITVEAARRAAKDILDSSRGGEDPAAKQAEGRQALTLSELVERWLTEHVEPKRKARTVEAYRGSMSAHVLPALGRRRAVELTRADVARLHVDISAGKVKASKATGGRARGGKIAANRALNALAAALSWAAGVGIVPEKDFDPCKRVERFKEEGKERYLSTEEMTRLGDALRLAETTGIPWAPKDEAAPGGKHLPKEASRREVFGPHAAGAVRLLLTTGMRLREVLCLEWTSYDRERGLLRLKDSKTGRKVVALSDIAIAVLEGIPRTDGGRYVIAGSTAGMEDEKPRADLHKPWAAIRRHAGLEDLRLHDLRHSFASIGASEGAALPQLGRLLGHSQPSTTARYSHISFSAEKRVADLIGAKIATALGLPGGAEVIELADRRRA